MFSGIKDLLKRFWVEITLILFACYLGVTDALNSTIRAIILKIYTDFKTGVWPLIPNIAAALLVLYTAFRLYGWARHWLILFLEQNNQDPDTKSMVLQSAQVVYWIAAVVLAALMVWSDFLSRLTIGLTPLLLAIWASCGDQIKAMVSGWAIRLMGHIKIGDVITFVTTPAISGKLIAKGKATITLEKTEEIEKDTPQGKAKFKTVKHLIVPNVKVVAEVIAVDVSEEFVAYVPVADPSAPAVAPAPAEPAAAAPPAVAGTPAGSEPPAGC